MDHVIGTSDDLGVVAKLLKFWAGFWKEGTRKRYRAGCVSCFR